MVLTTTQEAEIGQMGEISPFSDTDMNRLSYSKTVYQKASMKSPFPHRSEFEESLNIYPNKFLSLKLEWFLWLLGALGILGFLIGLEKGDYGFTWNVTRGGVK